MHSTNVYTNTHFELHILMCDFIEKNLMFSRPIQEAYAQIPEKERPMPILKCPLLPVSYIYIYIYIYKQFFTLAFCTKVKEYIFI